MDKKFERFWEDEALVHRVLVDYLLVNKNHLDERFFNYKDFMQVTELQQHFEQNVSHYSIPMNRVLLLKDILGFGLDNFLLFSDFEDTNPIDIVELDLNAFTVEGLHYFRDILDAKIDAIHSDGDFGFSIILKDVSASRIEEFALLLAGYVSQEKYNLYINNTVEEMDR